jgi:hypothetical protein
LPRLVTASSLMLVVALLDSERRAIRMRGAETLGGDLTPPEKELKTSSAAPSSDAKGITRRDVLIALTGGIVGVPLGVAGSVATLYLQDRLEPALATADLIVVPEVLWTVGLGWSFCAPQALRPPVSRGPYNDPAGAINSLVKHGYVRQSPLRIRLNIARPGDSPAVVRRIAIIERKLTSPRPADSYSSPPVTVATRGNMFIHGTDESTNGGVLAAYVDAPNPIIFEQKADASPFSGKGKAPEVDIFATQNIRIDPHLTESRTIEFRAVHSWCDFALELTYDVEGRTREIRVDQTGKHFSVASSSDTGNARYELQKHGSAGPYIFKIRQ